MNFITFIANNKINNPNHFLYLYFKKFYKFKVLSMKKAVLSTLVITFVLVSCNQKSKEDATHESDMKNNDTTVIVTDTVRTETKEAVSGLYACPMHPEVQGEMNDKCSKCGMKLTEPVQ